MSAPLDSRWNFLDWLTATFVERTSRTSRSLAATLYLMLGFFAVMQIANPGAMQRIVSQDAGRSLVACLAGLMLLTALFTLGDIALRRPRTALEPGVADALLHLTAAGAGAELCMLHQPLPGLVSALLFGVPGLVLVGAGLHRLSGAAFSGARVGDGLNQRLRAQSRRDGVVRGSAFGVFGVFAFVGAVPLLDVGLDGAQGPLALVLFGVTAVALFGYGLHAFWSLREEERHWAN
jgi:hypothetical protein